MILMYLTLAAIPLLLSLGPQNVKADCSMSGTKFSAGDIWHPKLMDANTNFCVTCYCYEVASNGETNMNCTSEMCPEGCTGGPEEDQCCNICSGGKSGVTGDDPDAVTPPLLQSFNGLKMCSFKGRMYNHGDTYSNTTESSNERCQLCTCNNGETKCSIKSCSPIRCHNSFTPAGDCCQACQEPNIQWKPLLKITSARTSRNSKIRDCISGDRYFLNGHHWHPRMGPLGEMKCVTCNCTNGTVNCSRLKCPPVSDLPCEKPELYGQCCPNCNEQAQSDQGSLPDSPYQPSPSRPVSRRFRKAMCLPSRISYLAYKSDAKAERSRILQHLFFPLHRTQNGATQPIRHHRIIMMDSWVHELTVQTLSSEEVEKLRNITEFVQIGGVVINRIKKFEVKERFLNSHCLAPPQYAGTSTEHNSSRLNVCCEAVGKLGSILKLKDMRHRDRCRRNEQQIVTNPLPASLSRGRSTS